MDEPARKLLIEDIKKCVKRTNGAWNLFFGDVTINIKLVWIQGHIKELVDENKDIIIIRDSTGDVKVINCSALAGNKSWMEEGVYCSVVGFIRRVLPEPEILAMRLINENDNPISPYMWKLEVADLKRYLVENEDNSRL